MPSFVVSNTAWNRSKTKAPSFSAHGQIFFRESIPERYRGMVAPHEITHVMKQVQYPAYLAFVSKTPDMLDLSSIEAALLLENSAKHRGIDIFNEKGTLDTRKLKALSEADTLKLYDELNATLYGHIDSGKMEGLSEPLRHAFHDFDAYAKELTELHERFKAAREAKALQDKAGRDTMGAGKYSLKEDENNGTVRRNQTESEGAGTFRGTSAQTDQASDTGRSRQNRQGVGSEVRSEVGSTVRREEFLREHRERGDRSVRLKGDYLYAYHEATETELNDDAKKTVEILKDLDIPYFTNTDGLHIYANGNTRTSTQSVTIHDGANTKIAVSANMETEGVATAYHEAFHFLRDVAPALRAKLQETIRENIVENKSYEAFSSRIAEAYQIPLDPSQRTKAQEAKFQEELNAYICGEIMAQNPGSEAWNLIKDFAKDVDQLVIDVTQMYSDFKARQKGETKFSLKTDSQGRELSEEQQKFFKDSKVRDEDGRLLTMYHGTRAENGDFTVFDYSKAVKKGGLGLKALGKGNYFTSKQLNGSERFGSRVIEAYLNVTNPFIYDGANGDTVSLAEQVQKKTGISTQGISADALQDAMRKLGYDGIVEYRRDGSLGIAVTFDSEQIKYTTNQKPTSDPDIRYSLKNVDGYEQFRRDLQEWVKDGRPSGERFILGSTGSVLQGLGAIESDIYMNGDKISTILKEHPEMSLREIQRIPEMLEDPVLVLKSKGTGKGGNNSRMVLYSSIKAQNGQPVLAVLDLRP